MAALPVRVVRVEPGGNAERGYDVAIGAGLLNEAGTRIRAAVPSAARAFTAYDGALVDDRIRSLMNALRAAGLHDSGAGMTATEEHKTFESLEFLLDQMVAARLERDDVLVALGGGIVGDVAGLAAALYRRGIRWVACPTTLLAMVDASVGGKTAVNVRIRNGEHSQWERRKNMAGVFHQPSLVLADVSTLSTLPPRELRCGLAECIKHGLLSADWSDATLLDWTEANIPAILRLDAPTLVELVARNVQVKASVVAADERETSAAPGGGRMALNLGHTFAHALEALPELQLKHGEAVALGLRAAAATAHAMGLCGPDLCQRLERLLGPAGVGLPTALPNLPDTTTLLRLMHDDKKVAGGRIRLILPTTPGRVRIVAGPPPSAIAAGLDSIRAGRPPAP